MKERKLSFEYPAPKIIKGKNQKTSSILFGGLIKHQVLNAEEEAHSILLAARETVANLVAEAHQAAEEIRREAYQAGRDEAENELLENLLAIKAERSQVLLTIEKDVLKLAVKLAEKIIGKEIQQDETSRAEIVLNALRHARQQEMLTVRVNTADLSLLNEMRDKINSFGRAQFIDFVADQAVTFGGCIIESSSGTIDARLETQLRILENALLARASSEARED
ncbi:MAG: FliH/SctL family protein [Actinomycetota bacterium]